MKPIRWRAFAAALALLCAPATTMAQVTPFSWPEGGTVSITTGNSSQSVALKMAPAGPVQVRIYSACTAVAFIRKGTDSSVAATASDMPIAPGEVEVLTLVNAPNAPTTYLAMIAPSGSCTIYFTVGSGI